MLQGDRRLEGVPGAIVKEVTIPHAVEAKSANNLIWAAEGFAYHHDDLRDQWRLYGRYTRTAHCARRHCSADRTTSRRSGSVSISKSRRRG